MLESYAGAWVRYNQVRKPKAPEGGSDVTIRESPDELTLRAEEVNTSKAYVDVNHIKPKMERAQTGYWWCKQVSLPAKVFEAHAVPQGLCANLINALNLLANQQKDGDSPIQSIVAGVCERSRKGIVEGLRNNF